MAFWMTKVPGGGFAMGEALDEAEARLMIVREQGRASVTFNRRSGRYRWTVVLDEGKTSHGWAETEEEGWWFVKGGVPPVPGHAPSQATWPLDPAPRPVIRRPGSRDNS
jgi:hypothetical protein